MTINWHLITFYTVTVLAILLAAVIWLDWDGYGQWYGQQRELDQSMHY